jgi:hypothetical protein
MGNPPNSAHGMNMVGKASYYFGNAANDQVRDSGWFVGQFVPHELGLRHQTDVEIKWALHPDGDKRPQPAADGNATTISVLIRGTFLLSFYTGETPRIVKLAREGDYVVFGPDMVHSWEAIGETLVLSIRFPSIERRAARM